MVNASQALGEDLLIAEVLLWTQQLIEFGVLRTMRSAQEEGELAVQTVRHEAWQTIQSEVWPEGALATS